MTRGATAGFGSAVLNSRAWFPAVFALAGALAGAVLFAVAPRTYHASMTILAVREPVLSSYVRTDETNPEERLQRIAGTTLLYFKLVPIIRTLGLYPGESNMERAVAEMQKHMTIDRTASGPAPRYELRFKLTFQTTDAGAAVAVTERLAGLFLDENPEPPSPPDPADVALSQQLDVTRERLLKMEATLKTWRKGNPGRRFPARLLGEYQRLQEEYKALLHQLDDRHPSFPDERRALGEFFTIVDAPHLVGVDAPDAMPFLKQGATAGLAYGFFLWFVAFLWDQRESPA